MKYTLQQKVITASGNAQKFLENFRPATSLARLAGKRDSKKRRSATYKHTGLPPALIWIEQAVIGVIFKKRNKTSDLVGVICFKTTDFCK